MLNHRWSFEEDYICCIEYLRFIFKRESTQRVNDLIYNLSLRLTKIPSGSIRMKLQNIKQICMEYNFEDHLEISPLAQYSMQCKRAFGKAVTDLNAELDSL